MVPAGGESTEKGELCYGLLFVFKMQRFECLYADRTDKVGKARLRGKGYGLAGMGPRAHEDIQDRVRQG